jgi:hypothetical protein
MVRCEDIRAQRLVVGVALARPGRAHDLDVEPLVAEKALVARHEQRQVVDRVHHRGLDFLQVRCHALPLQEVGSAS